MSARTAIAAAALSASLLWAASPEVGASWLAWGALVPAATVVLRARGEHAARLAVPLAYGLYLELLLVPALPFGLAEGQWGDPALPVMVADSPVLFVALVAIPLFAALLYLLRFGEAWGAEWLSSPWAGIATVVVPALAWTSLDLLRAKFDPGGFWGPLFLTQEGVPPGGLAALAGPSAITFAIVVVNYSVAAAVARGRVASAAVAAGTLAAAAIAGPALVPEPGRASLTVAAVQPGYDTAEDERPLLRNFVARDWDRAALDVALDLAEPTRRAARAGAELVVWPEATMYVNPRQEPEVIRFLRELARSAGASLLVPYFQPQPDISEALAITPAGRASEPRSKRRGMWYLGEGRGAHSGPEPLTVSGIRLGVLLGIDTQDPWLAAERAHRGASLLVAATHDWGALATEQRAYARLGAIGAGLPLVRADWRYGSAIYGPDGEVLADAGEELRRTTVLATVPEPGGVTAYSRIGDAFGWVAVALALGAWLAALARRRAARRDATRAVAPSFGDREPRRAPTPRRRARARPRATAGPTRRPP